MSNAMQLEHGDWELRLGDCLDPVTGLASLADGCADHVITDPPYDERTHTRARSLKDGGSDIPIDFAWLTDMAHVAPMLRVAGRWVVAFCAVEQIGAYKAAAGDEAWTRAGIWHRTDGTPQLSADRPAQAAEGIAIMHSLASKRRWNAGGNRGHWTSGVEREGRVHPTQKPLGLIETLIRQFTDPGDLVIDPFAGSGTTGVACRRLGRRFLGWEKDPKFNAAAMKRIGAAREQLGLMSRAKAPKVEQGDMFKAAAKVRS